MNPSKEQILLSAKRELFNKSFYRFFLYFWDQTSPEVLVNNWHIKVLCDELQAIGYRLKNREKKAYDLIINVPPGSSKSTIGSILFPVWLWTIDPTMQVLSASYGESLSLDLSVRSRDVITSPKFRELYPELNLKEDQNNKHLYENNHKGRRVASSVGGGITGKHYHLILVDDPLIANPTDTQVVTANDWMTTKLSTRKVNKAVSTTVLIMQRVKDNDCTDTLLKRGNVRQICLPAELSPDTTEEFKQYYKDGLFDPVRLNLDAIAEARGMGLRQYSCQFLQNPIPQDGGILKASDFQYCDEAPEGIDWSMFVDTAYTNKQTNDASAMLVAGKHGNDLYIKYAKAVREEFPQLIKTISATAGVQGTRRIYVEPKASGLSVIQTLRSTTGLNIIDLDPPKDSKLARVNSISAFVEGKRVYLVRGGWNENFIDECTGFPLMKNDDQVDTLVYAIQKLIQKGYVSRIGSM